MRSNKKIANVVFFIHILNPIISSVTCHRDMPLGCKRINNNHTVLKLNQIEISRVIITFRVIARLLFINSRTASCFTSNKNQPIR